MLDDLTMPRLRVITHSAVRLEADDGTVVYIDPFDLPTAPHDADIVLITHAHYDHLSAEDVGKVARGSTALVAPASTRREVERLGLEEVRYLSAGDSCTLRGVPIEAVAAYNTDPSRLDKHPRANGWLGYVVTIDGARYYHAGDTDRNPDNASVRCDVALVPVGGTFTMDAAQAAAFVNEMAPKAAVPIHYGSIVGTGADADAFAAAVDPSIAVVRKMES